MGNCGITSNHEGKKDRKEELNGMVTLKNFTLKSPLTHADDYGIHISGSNTVTFENLLIENLGRSGVDFINCNNITINNLEAKNNARTGIAVKD